MKTRAKCSFLAPAALITVLTGCDGIDGLREMVNSNIMYVPSSSMEPTLPVNSRFTAIRIDSADIERGDLVIVQTLIDDVRVLRVIGMPGDSVSVEDGIVVLNGEKLRMEPLGEHSFRTQDDLTETGQKFREYLPGDETGHLVLNLRETPLDNTATTILREDRYYLLGDNRDNAADSRMERVRDANVGGVGVVEADEITHRVDMDSVSVG